MTKGLRRGWIAALLFVFMLAALFIPNKNVHADTVKQKAGTVVMDVERFTIGQGFYLEPQQLPFYEGETVKDVLQRFIGEDKMVLRGDYYMEGIKGADLGIDFVKVPDYISKTGINGPTTEEAKAFGNGNDNDLMEFDYFTHAGWVYLANNIDPVTGINSYQLKDGDVIRMQFTLVLGLDLTGIDYDSGKVFCTISNKDEAIKEIAQINSSAQKQKLLANSTIKSKYETLKKSVQNAVIPQSTLDKEVSELKKAVDAFLNPKPVVPTPAKPSTPSIKVGTTVKSSTGKEYVKVTSISKKTVEYVKPSQKTYTNVIIPATVKISGTTYKVTAISANACKGMTKLKKVTIGKNVGKIGSKAFNNCKKLSQITIASTTLSSGKVAANAFSGIKKNAVVKVPKSKYNAYKKFLQKKGNKTIKVKK